MGDEDHMFLPAVRYIITKHTNSWLEVIGNSGHVCNVDQPKEFNTRAILFLKKMSAGSSTEKPLVQLATC